MPPTTEEIVRFARCMATDPVKSYSDYGRYAEARGRMSCGTDVWATYYNYNAKEDDADVLTRLRIFCRGPNEGWWFVMGYDLSPPVNTK